MSDLRTLHDAFAELDRRADAAAARTAPVVRPRRTVRLVPVAATVVAVAGLVAGAAWLVPSDSGTHTATPPATSSTTRAPASPDDLIARFGAVLGDTATFEVTQRISVPRTSPSRQPEPGVTPLDGQDGSPMVVGTLTSADGRGTLGLMIYSTDSEPGEWCNLPRAENCTVTTLPDGSRLATGTRQPAPGAVSYLACLKRPDGTMILINVSNQDDPSGAAATSPAGRILSPQSPLTPDRLKEIVTSDKW
ncbi:hypothetical protein [Lentzea cavernae]|uniref:Uncharacterized protein n=1 Tax=Lentzea cavernae TaxID=2020703 RepID=A0ABQ3MWG5_9PSEU|nr:hypothetical protein [Lentzea cavernae]GHH63097.1 hypothetical protein GCM10017774_91840 [Lentzea cavernae]